MGVITTLGSYSKQGWPQCGKGFKRAFAFDSVVPPANKLVGRKGVAATTRTVCDFSLLFIVFAAMKSKKRRIKTGPRLPGKS